MCNFGRWIGHGGGHPQPAIERAALDRDYVDPSLLRRNIVVSGINLLSLNGAQFTIGDVLMEGTGPCHPCSRMEETFGPGGYSAVRGHGGITARVLTAGVIRVGDQVSFERLTSA